MANGSSTEKSSAQQPDAAGSSGAPIIIGLGKSRRKQVKRLRKGRGKLMGDVIEALDELKEADSIAANAQPVVFVVQQRRGRRRAKRLLSPYF